MRWPQIKLGGGAFYAKRPWYHPVALARRLINYYLAICIALFLMQNSLLFPRWISGAVLSEKDATAKASEFDLLPLNQVVPETSPFQGYVRCDFRKVAPSLASIIDDARGLIRTLDRLGYGPVYVWGESVGSGGAAQVCADPTLPVHGLTLLTPWDSLTHAAEVHYPVVPVSMLLWDKFNSIANLHDFTKPICVVCSTKDTILPLPLGLNLYDHLQEPKKLILREGAGHNDWPNSPYLAWWDAALDFIAPRK